MYTQHTHIPHLFLPSIQIKSIRILNKEHLVCLMTMVMFVSICTQTYFLQMLMKYKEDVMSDVSKTRYNVSILG